MKPSLKRFTEAAEKGRGNVSKIADLFGVSRVQVYKWINNDPAFKEVIEDYRGRLLDNCLRTANVVAMGIPKLDTKNQIIGWIERPDANMLKFLITKYGKNEGFGDSMDITSNGKEIKTEPITIEIIDRREQVKQVEEDEE